MRILWEDYIVDSTLTETGGSMNYPVSNLAHSFLARRYQATSTSAVATATFDVAKTINCIFWSYTNATQLVFTFKDSGDSTLKTVTVDNPSGGSQAEYFDDVDSVKSIDVALSGSAGVFLGAVRTGKYFQMPDFVESFSSRLVDSSLVSESSSNQSAVGRIRPGAQHGFDFRGLSKAVKDAMFEVYEDFGQGPLFIDMSEGNSDFLGVIYARISTWPKCAKNGATFNVTGMNIKECK